MATFENLIESIPRELLIFSLVRSDGDNPAEVHVHASDLSGELFALYRRPVQHLGLTEKQALRHFTTLGFPVVDPAKLLRLPLLSYSAVSPMPRRSGAFGPLSDMLCSAALALVVSHRRAPATRGTQVAIVCAGIAHWRVAAVFVYLRQVKP